MPLPMQGNELAPSHKNVGRRRVRSRSPHRRGRNGPVDPRDEIGEPAATELPPHGLAIGSPRMVAMRANINQGSFDLLGIGVAELDARKRLEMLVEQPGVVNDRLQNEGFAPRDGGAMAAEDRARRKLRAQHRIGAAASGASSEWRMASGGR